MNRSRTGCTHKPSKVYYWLVEHQGVIPRNIAEIARQSGIQEMTIRKFLYRRRDAAMEYLKVLGKVSALENIQLVSIKGQKFLTQQIAQVELQLDQYDLTVTLDCMLKSGVAVHCRLAYVEYTRLFPQKPVEPTYFGEEQNDFATRLADPRSSSLSG